MAPKLSAGLLLFRHRVAGDEVLLEVLLGHPGGPYWARKDHGAWSIPKGEYDPGEDPLSAAKREFEEELGAPAPEAIYRELGSVTLSSGKVVTAWAAEADFDARAAVSNVFEMEWPPRSGRMQAFPEIDRAEWFGIELACVKLVKGQQPFIDRLVDRTGLDAFTAPGQ